MVEATISKWGNSEGIRTPAATASAYTKAVTSPLMLKTIASSLLRRDLTPRKSDATMPKSSDICHKISQTLPSK